MKTIEIRESNLPNAFRIAVETEAMATGTNGSVVSFQISNQNNFYDMRNDCVMPFSVLIATAASIMSNAKMKSKDHKTAIIFANPKGSGSMLMACISEYIPAEEGEGNWNVYFSFDPESIKGIPEDSVKNYTDLQSIEHWAACYRNIMLNTHSRKIDDEEVINQLTIISVKCLINWLDENASENDVINLEIKEAPNYLDIPATSGEEATPIKYEDYKNSWITYATASVEIVKGQKIKSMTFGEEMKAIAKGNVDSM